MGFRINCDGEHVAGILIERPAGEVSGIEVKARRHRSMGALRG